MGALAGIAGGAVGGIWGAQTSNRIAQNKLNQGQLGSDIYQLQNLLLPYDQLVSMGRIAPGERGGIVGGLQGNQSVLGQMLAGYENSAAAGDPAFAALRDTISKGLDLGDSGLPRDVQDRITKSVRAGQAARGLLDSSSSAIQEAGALAGGAEAIRAERLGQAQQYFSSVTQNAINSLFPNIGTLYQGELSRASDRAKAALGAGGIGASIYGSSAQATGEISKAAGGGY